MTMQYNLVDLLRSEHILLKLSAVDPSEAIQKMTDALAKTGHVAPEYADDVMLRERTFPTGLPTQPWAVAIPHADPDHVNQSAVCIATLDTPISFGQMGTDGSLRSDVQFIFLLAIKEQEKQVEMLQQLMTLIQATSLLDELMNAERADDALELIQQSLNQE